MCRATTVNDVPNGAAGFLRPSRKSGAPRLDIRAFYLRLSSPATAELSLTYLPAIGGAALGLNGRALTPAAPAEVKLRQVAGDDAAAYASADRVAAAEGARFEVYAGKEPAAEGAFVRRPGGGWRVECRRRHGSAAAVAEVVVLAEDGVLMRGKARASRRGLGCGATTRLEGIPEEATDVGWGCECGGLCGEDEEWEVVGDDDHDGSSKDEEEVETVRWAMEMGVWAVCLGVGLVATARRFRRKRAFW